MDPITSSHIANLRLQELRRRAETERGRSEYRPSLSGIRWRFRTVAAAIAALVENRLLPRNGARRLRALCEHPAGEHAHE